MPRTARPSLETLEARALQTAMPSPTAGLVGAITAVPSRVAGGVQVALTFTETNTSNHDINVTYGPSDDDFLVSKGGKVVWNQNSGLFLPMFLRVETLQPGQSITVQGTWDGRSNLTNPGNPGLEGPALRGKFTVSNTLDDKTATATVIIPRAWTGATKPASTGHSSDVHAMATVEPLAL